ncbi:MAG: rod shape-determining protein RodA [Planctomycetota bacterium]|nr:MAG: rod shape-determining protein RodA [Planctomycetota bacterium]REJ92931.1 MAG: rod shape-determining protein RodA [Planctomycetota bacterium]REK26139.1 MAG: rod shape-determining protein RodA [Planctomycetota bacterium]REK33509.1 MAG: rod shape-determining protein RodA [Planctomycetota bacterium]
MTPGETVRRLPWVMVLAVIGLLAIGWSGIARGDELAGGGVFATRQAVWIVLGIPAMLAALWVPYRELKPWAYGFFAVCLCLLVAVYFFPAKNYAHRWIPLGFADLQPSELAKLAYILALAHYLMHRRNYRRLTGLIAPFVITAIPVLLIVREPDLGTSLLFFPVLFSMLFAAGARLRHLLLIAMLGVAMLPVMWSVMSAEQRSRVTSVFTQKDGGPAPRGDGYHLHQSKQVIALGGVWGSEMSGMPVSDPRAYRLPAGRTDFVFSLVSERWGLWGAIAVFLLYLLLIGRGLIVASATHEPFGRLLCVGVMALLAAQVVINTGMTVGLMPITGLTLPLMSYGGSSLVTTCFAIGLVLNVGLRPGYEMTGEPFRFGRSAKAA